MAYAKSETTIDEIITAARKMFLAKNYADVSMDDISVTAGVTKGAVYHHFESKEALYVTMMLKFLREFQDMFEAEVIKEGSCRERLHRLALFFFDLPHETRDIFKLVRRDINVFKSPIRNQLIRAYQAALPQQIEAIVRDGIRGGELAPVDPRLLSWLKVAMVEVILSRYAESIFNNANETVDFIINLLFDGVGKKHPAGSRSRADGGSRASSRRIAKQFPTRTLANRAPMPHGSRRK